MTLAVPRPLLLAAAFGFLLVFPAGAGAVGAFPGGGDNDSTDAPALSHAVGERDFDVRAREARTPEPPPPSLGAARADLRRQLGPQGVLDLDPVTGTPRVVARLDGFLTGPSTADPADIALGFVGDNLAAFGLDGSDLGTLRLADRRTDGWGITHLSWSQEFRGVPSLDSGLKAAVDEQGRLINITGSPQPDLAVRETAPDFGASSALALAQRAGGESVALPPVTDRPGGPERVTEFGDGSDARLVLFAEGSDQLRLAWRVLNVESGTEIYDTVVDASTGETLKRENLVNFAAGAVWEYFPEAHQLITAGSGGDGGGARALKTFPAGWGTSSTALFGNFAHVYSDVNDDANNPSSPDSAGQCGGGAQACGDIPPNQAGPNWNYTFFANPDGTGIFTDCNAVFPVCTWRDAFTPYTAWNFNIAQNGTQVYYYVSKFHDWLAAAPFNFGGAEGFEGADKVNAQIFDGAASDPGNPGTPDEEHLNNANMATLPGADTPPRMQMYLFSGIPLDGLPEVNGGDDASVMYHEYAHGLSNRLVNFTLGQSALNGFQADSMGEGWSDWYALDYLEANNIDEDDREGPPSNTPGADNDGEMNVGVYPFGGDLHALRTMGLDCAVGTSDIDCDNTANNQAGQGGYTYGDMGKILCNSTATQCQPEVHADGEIWAQAIWDLRQRFRQDYNPADFTNAHNTGLDRVRAIVTEGMRLSAPNPTFLDMRNAIIQADQALFGGADVGRIWDVFAFRGMGYFAASLGGNDTTPVEDFSTPPNCSGGGCGTLSGRVLETESGDAVPNAIVEILGPGNLFDQADANGNYSIANVPAHNYPYVAVSAAGYEGELRTNVNVGAGGGTLNLGATRDWAALSGGAQVTAFSQPDLSNFGCGPAGAFDLSLATGWGSTSPNSSQGPGGQKSVTVRLPRKVNITTFAIDPGATCGDDDSASTGGFEILTSETNSGFQRAAQGNFVAGNNHHLNEITPSGNSNGIQFVRFVMRTPQIPNTPGSSGGDFMDVSEVEVWGRPSSSSGPGPGPGPGGARCGGRRATKVGTAGRNTITGTNGRDVIAALGGNDRVRGRGGNDLICLGGGRDVANGGGGKDDIRGDAGNDSISGAAGNDKLNGGGGKDTLGGGGGKDTLIGAGGRDTCTGNGGRDVARSCERRRSI